MNALRAKDEVEEADLGDERLHARLERLLGALGSRPNLSIPGHCWRTGRNGGRLSLL